MSTTEFAYVRVDFDVGTSGLPPGDPVHWLVESIKRGYIEQQISTSRFEEQVDAILRYRDQIDWRTYGSSLRIPGADLWRYPALVEWVS